MTLTFSTPSFERQENFLSGCGIDIPTNGPQVQLSEVVIADARFQTLSGPSALITVTFTPDNWFMERLISLHAVEDGVSPLLAKQNIED